MAARLRLRGLAGKRVDLAGDSSAVFSVAMRDRDLYARILDVQSPWTVTDVDLDLAGKEVVVHVAALEGARLGCPTCGKDAPRYDSRKRRWRQLDTCQYRTILECDVPRVECGEHGVLAAKVPWSEPGSRFTALFEALVIDWLKEASISAVRRVLGLSWSEVDSVMKRAVKRGLERRGSIAAKRVGVDETSFQKRHEYVTVVSDPEKGRVLHVADDRKAASLDTYYVQLTPQQLAAIEVVTMDLCGAYIASTKRLVQGAEGKIAFDRFHVAALLSEAIDDVRRVEHRKLTAQGDSTLKGTRYAFLSSPSKLGAVLAGALEALKGMALKTSRAWAIKESE
jgi:transposase